MNEKQGRVRTCAKIPAASPPIRVEGRREGVREARQQLGDRWEKKKITKKKKEGKKRKKKRNGRTTVTWELPRVEKGGGGAKKSPKNQEKDLPQSIRHPSAVKRGSGKAA